MSSSRRVKRKKPRTPTWAKLSVGLGALLMIVSGVGIAAAHAFIGSALGAIQQQNLLGDTGIQGNNINGPITMLLVGIDVRPDQKDDSVRSDTIIILYIPPSHDQAVLVSIPRDTQVKIPDYPKTHFKGWTTKINAAFQGGYQGPGTEIEKRGRGVELLSQTIKQAWGITFNGAAIIDFNGFEAVMEELGGVTMCVDHEGTAIHLALDKNGNILDGPIWFDQEAGQIRGIPPGGKPLVYKVGCQHMAPNVALEYSRLRGEGPEPSCCPNGDYDRQRHQQQLIKEILKEATSKNLLKDPLKLNKVMQAAGKAFVLDTGGVPVADYLFTFKDVAGSDLITVRTNAGHVDTVPGSSDEQLNPQSLEMMAALKAGTIISWLGKHPDFIGPA